MSAPALILNNAFVANRVTFGGAIFLHDEKGSFTKIKRDQQLIHTGRISYVLQKGLAYRFTADIPTSAGDIVVVTLSAATPNAMDLVVTGSGASKTYTTVPGEAVPSADANALTVVDAVPGVEVNVQALPDVIFTSRLTDGFAALSLGGDADEQHALLDNYKRVIDGMLYRHDVTTVQFGATWSQTINIGPITITLSVDTSTLEGSVSASVLGISLGSAKLSPTSPVDLSVNVFIAKASVKVSIHDGGIWLEAHASTPFNGSADYGPKEIYHF